MEYWLTRTGIGISFGLAALLGLMVGLAVVAQTLYASVTERLKEFGTLKAMGAGDDSIGWFPLAQAVGNATLGSAAGLLGSVAIARPRSTAAASPTAEPSPALPRAWDARKRATQRSSAPIALSVPNSLTRSVTEAYRVWATTARPTSSPSTAASPKLMPMPVRVSQNSMHIRL